MSDYITCDIAIIGGGYTGLSAALQAANLGAKVCLIEAGTIGQGGSGRNVGLVNAGLWLPPDDIASKLGSDIAQRLTTHLARAPDLVFDLINQHDIACDPVRNGTLHCAHSPSGLRDLQNRFAQLRARDAPVAMISEGETARRVGTSGLHGALFDPRAGTIQPLAYAKGLARAAHKNGAMLFEHSPALSVQKDAQFWRIKTPDGQIRATSILVATNGYTIPFETPISPQIPMKTIPIHYFQAATPPLNDQQRAQILPNQEGCWDTALIMSSWRMDVSGRLIIGGMGRLDHIAGNVHSAWLRRKLSKMFPMLRDTPLAHSWFGRIAMTPKHIPKILQFGPNAFAIFGYSGRGIGPGTFFGTQMGSALVSGDLTHLPVPPERDHSVAFSGLCEAFYETGATLSHLIRDRGAK